MNFNHQPNKGGQPPQQQQQQQPLPQPQRNTFPALPPQLANLTPQQLQQLRNQPQFQALMKNYAQRQQMIQQQQMMGQQPQMQGQSTNTVPMTSQNIHPSQQFNQQSPLINQQQQQQQQQQAPLMGSAQANLVMPPRQQSMGQIPNPQTRNVNLQQVPGQIPQQGLPQTRPGIGSQGASGMVPPHIIAQQKLNASQGVAPPDQSISSSFPSELLNKIPLRELTLVDEWSEKLRKEGKEVPTDLKVYESIIQKDLDFVKKKSNQVGNNKLFFDSLVKDIKSYNEIKQLRMNAINLSSKGQFNNSIWGDGYQGYGNGITNTSTRLLLPHHNKRYSAVPDIMLTDRQMSNRILKRLESDKKQQLVPIRLEFDQERDKFKLRDTFLWDLNEDILPIENFVALLIEDYKFIPQHHGQTILASVKEQLRDYHKRPDKIMGELRIPIKIDITINNTQLVDQFEWDILNFEENDPEEFATIMCDEMNLPGEFSTAVAHSIREQTQLFHKSLVMVGYSFDGSPVYEDEIRTHVLPSLRLSSQGNSTGFGSLVDDFFSILRNPATVPDFTPSLVKLTQLEVERLDKEIERESRRKRRHNLNDVTDGLASGLSSGRGTSRRSALHAGRGGPVLPDLSDIPKTFRTPAPSSILPGGIDLGVPDIYGYNEVVVHRSQVKNPDYKPPSPPYLNENGDDKRNRVRYNNDTTSGKFLVSINLSK